MSAATPATPIALCVPPSWHEAVTTALGASGLRPDPSAALGVSLAPGRFVMAQVDGWSQQSLPHLLVSARPHSVEVGPWVVPGVSPCARCVEADTFDVGALDDLPPLDPALLSIAAGQVAREVAAWRRAQTPSTWATSWRWEDSPLPEQRRWRRHPYCGCGWWEAA